MEKTRKYRKSVSRRIITAMKVAGGNDKSYFKTLFALSGVSLEEKNGYIIAHGEEKVLNDLERYFRYSPEAWGDI